MEALDQAHFEHRPDPRRAQALVRMEIEEAEREALERDRELGGEG